MVWTGEMPLRLFTGERTYTLAQKSGGVERDPNYHRPTDTADQLNYDEMARMADGFIRTVQVLAEASTPLP